MPNRVLRSGILTSDRVNQLDAHAEVFYRRLMSVVDDFGRFDARPSILRAACYPLRLDDIREADITGWLMAAAATELLILYEVDGKPFLELTKFAEPRAKASKYPQPPASVRICSHLRADESMRAQTHVHAPVLRLTDTDTYCGGDSRTGGRTREDEEPPSLAAAAEIQGETPAGREEADAEAMLTAEGFDAADPIRRHPHASAEQVRLVIAKADARAAKDTLGDRRAFIAQGIRARYRADTTRSPPASPVDAADRLVLELTQKREREREKYVRSGSN